MGEYLDNREGGQKWETWIAKIQIRHSISTEEGAKVVVPELFMIWETGKLGQGRKEVEIIWSSLVLHSVWKNYCLWYFELDTGIKKN